MRCIGNSAIVFLKHSVVDKCVRYCIVVMCSKEMNVSLLSEQLILT